jgi:CHAT domain-containing protein/tetratricopeptide (TPR) repeat protein
MIRTISLVLLLLISATGYCQKSSSAQALFELGKADTLRHDDEKAAIHFLEAAKTELKESQPDYDFASEAYINAAEVYLASKKYQLANDCYYEALPIARKASKGVYVFTILKDLGTLYEESRINSTAFNFPKGKKEETVQAHFSIITAPQKGENGKYQIRFAAGSNDGVYEGAVGNINALYDPLIKDRQYAYLGSIVVTKVYPNYSIGEAELTRQDDDFYKVKEKDLIYVPIRFAQVGKASLFLDIALLNIRFVDNYKKWLAHPRTLMFYNSPDLEKDVFAYMKNQIYQIYEMLHSDSTPAYHKISTTGRFQGKSMMDVMRDTKENDIASFLGYLRTYPRKYVGGTWSISEVYATWVLGDAPTGSQEVLDSLKAYINNKTLFDRYLANNLSDIKGGYFDVWMLDEEDLAKSKDYKAAYEINDVLEKVARATGSDYLLGNALFDHAFILGEEDKDSVSIDYYKNSRTAFEKAKDSGMVAKCVNNIALAYDYIQHFDEGQKFWDEAFKLKQETVKRDTSESSKLDLARSGYGSGENRYKQSKYNEAIEKYKITVSIVATNSLLSAKKLLAGVYSKLGKSYEKMGDYKNASDYYNLENTIRKALGDEQAMADALDNSAYLLSLLGKYREAYDIYNQAYSLHLKTNHKNDAGYSMSSIGQTLWSLGKYDSAIIAHNQAIKLREEADNKKGQAYSWKKLGALYKESGQPQKSLESYNKALALYKDIDDKESYASLLEDFASNYKTLKDYANSLKYYSEALEIYKELKMKTNIGNGYYNLSTVYYDDKRYEESAKMIDSSIVIQKEINDQSDLLYSYLHKGFIEQFFYSDNKKALLLMQDALKIAIATTSKNNIAFSNSAIGHLYSNMSMYDSALVYYNLSLSDYKKLEDKKNEAQQLINLGFYYSELAEYAKARSYFEEAIKIAEKTENKSQKADCLSGISQIEYLSGEFAKAIRINEEVYKLWKLEKNPWGIATYYISLGNILNIQSEFGESVKNYEKADSIYKELRIENLRATTINNIGTIYFYQGNYDKSIQQFNEALKLLEKTNEDKRFISLVKGNIGEAYGEQKKYTEAEKWLNESIALARSIHNKKQMYETDMILGRLKNSTKDYKAAFGYFQEAYDLIKESGERPAMIQLEADWGKYFYYIKDLDNAIKHLQNCIDLSKAIGSRTYVWKAYATLAEIKNEQNNTKDAITQLEEAIKVVEELKLRITGGEEAKKIFANDESVVDLYQKMARYLKKLGRNDEALAYIEKSNIENLKLRFKNEGDISDSSQQNSNKLAKEKKSEISQYVQQTAQELSKPSDQQNKEKIARLEKMTTVAEADYQTFIVDLAKKYPNRTDLQQINVREFKSERKHIPADVAMLSYLITPNELSVFIVMRDSLIIKDIPIDKALFERKIKSFHTLSSNPATHTGTAKRGVGDDEVRDEKEQTLDELSQELYNILIAPAKDAIAGKKRIAIIPSGLLCYVPFHSLSTKSASGEVKYFGEEKQIFYVNKITTVTNGRNELMTEFKILAVGNPDKSLKNAETEVKNLQQMFPTALIYTGSDATKLKVLASQGSFNILHLATHGILDYSNPEESYLLFASDKIHNDDGRLKISDIGRMDNLDRYKMVTLSACETAVVQNLVEGWPISTASAFIEAGVPTVIATLWKVDDKATGILVEKFYENLKTMDKVTALQKAQEYVRGQKEYSDPYYWAPFQLVGLWQ